MTSSKRPILEIIVEDLESKIGSGEFNKMYALCKSEGLKKAERILRESDLGYLGNQYWISYKYPVREYDPLKKMTIYRLSFYVKGPGEEKEEEK